MDKWALVTDFDGTASVVDVGSALVRHFVGPDCWKEVDGSISGRRMTMKEAYEIVYAKMRASDEEMTAFILGFELDPGFKTAAALFAERGLPVLILSDGFTYYIDRLLKRDGLEWIPRIANELTVDGRTVTPTFPHHGLLDCDRCGNCKTYHVQKLQADGYRVAYFGDGHTDRCAAENADAVFAKDYLARYLTKNGVDFYPFAGFSDALPRLKSLLGIE